MSCLLADKAYDAEWLHEYCFNKGIKTIIPKKINVIRGRFRKKQQNNFSLENYHQRSNIESGFSAIKRKYGSSVLGKSLNAVNSELSCKALAHNLNLFSNRFSTEPFNFYKISRQQVLQIYLQVLKLKIYIADDLLYTFQKE